MLTYKLLLASSLITFGLVSGSCNPIYHPKPTVTVTSLITLLDKADTYETLINNQKLDENGFLTADICDSLLFTGLYGASLLDADNIHIEAARELRPDGVYWHRHPSRSCGPNQQTSRSTISRDMMVGLFWFFWRHNKLDLAKELFLDLRKNNYQLRGDGTLGELQMTPDLMQTLAILIKGLGGPSYTAELTFPVVFTQNTDFVAHLNVWHILLRAEIEKGISINEKAILKAQAENQPQNPLFSAAYHKFLDGNYQNAIQLLVDINKWPEDRLPSSLNYCSEWPVQRSYQTNPADWLPCPSENEEFTGAELPTIFHLVIQAP